MKNNTTTYFTDLNSCIVIIKSVPCYKCAQYGEIAYGLEVAERLEYIINALKNSLTEVAIVHYSDAAA